MSESTNAQTLPRNSVDQPATKQGFHPLIELTLTRIRESIREPEVLFWVFIFPVLLACALGLAFRNTAPAKTQVAVEESVNTARAAEIMAALEKSADVAPIKLAPAEAARALRTGNVALVVRTGDSNSVVYRYDPTRPESRTAKLGVDEALFGTASASPRVNAIEETVIEPGARYIDFLIPGLIGLNLMGSGMWGVGFAIVSARSKKLLKRFAATPMRRSHYLLSFMLSRLVFLTFEVVALVGFAWLVFGVVVHGSLVEVGLCSVVGAFSFSGLGLLVAARPRTVEGVSGLMNFVMLPMWLLSGTFFSASRFPDWLQPAIKALPLTALNDVMRAVMNEGVPLMTHWTELLIVGAWGLVGFLVALKIFRWQ